MPRNRYTKLIRKIERARAERLLKELADIAKTVRCQPVDPLLPPAENAAKDQRRIRRQQNRQYAQPRRSVTPISAHHGSNKIGGTV